MKATGIIRRIDDLGRIVIPKEIRKNLKINEGEKLEIFTNNDQIILQKYSNLINIKDIAEKITDSIYSITKKTVIITDTEYIVAVSGNYKKELLNKKISSELFKIIKQRNNKVINNFNIIEGFFIDKFSKINIITENGDIAGSLIIISDEINNELDQIINVNSIFLNKYLEE